MQIQHDIDLGEFENNLNKIREYMRGLVEMNASFVNAEVAEIYSDVLNQARDIINKMENLAMNAGRCRSEFHKNMNFNRAYYDAYGQIHPEAVGIIDESDIIGN